MDDKPIVLDSGNMNQPVLSKGLIYKNAGVQSQTIHKLLVHVRKKGIDWVPRSYGLQEGKHVLSYIEGFVPENTPSWLWKEDLLIQIAKRLSQWHNATQDFHYSDAPWYFQINEKKEVICHCDFAPYNCVFRNEKFAGLIDFDVCSPASRLWDLAYTAYRFIPLMPPADGNNKDDRSPFDLEETVKRLDLFLQAYAAGDKSLLYTNGELIKKTVKRIRALADWSESFAYETGKEEIMKHSIMYKNHADWLDHLTQGS